MSTAATERINGHAVASAEPRYDPVAMAKADAIRREAEAQAEAQRIAAEAEAEATRIKAAEEAEKQRIANEKAQMRLERERAEHAAKVTEANAKREAALRTAEAARQKAEAEQQAAEEEQARQNKSANSWRRAAKAFYIVCQIVALPVQMHAFWNPGAPWLIVTPLVLEGGAWVVQRGTRAAVDEHRPYWHYRLIAWCLALLAAGINLGHGLSAFDVWTAIGTSFCSVAGPGVDDLHENGRIRKRDGIPSRKERKAQQRAEKRSAKEKATREAQQRAEKKAAEEAARQAAEKLAAERAQHFPKVWERAVKLAAALGEITVTEAVWKRAHKDIEGTEPHESVDVIRTRNAAERRAAAARSEAPGNTPSKVTNAQRVIQINGSSKRSSYRPTPPRRMAGDTPRYHRAARVLAGETKRKTNASKKAANPTTD